MTGNTIGLIKEKPLLERIKDLEIDNEKLFNPIICLIFDQFQALAF